MRTRFTSTALVVALLTGAASGAIAQAAPDALGRCLADNTTGKDRKELARWIFAAMTGHPEMKSMSAATAADVEASTRQAAAIFTKLLADTCSKEIRAAVDAGGASALESGFQMLGQLAMQELMTNPQVAGTLGSIEKYVDRARIDAALRR